MPFLVLLIQPPRVEKYLVLSADLVLTSYFPVADFAPGAAALALVLTKPVEKWVFIVVVAELFHPGYTCLRCIELQGRGNI